LIARVGGGTGGKGKVAKGEGNSDVCVYRERERDTYVNPLIKLNSCLISPPCSLL
jgi:hypothetical protein